VSLKIEICSALPGASPDEVEDLGEFINQIQQHEREASARLLDGLAAFVAGKDALGSKWLEAAAAVVRGAQPSDVLVTVGE
jgi:hypothetical protein